MNSDAQKIFAFFGTGDFKEFQEDLFWSQRDNLFKISYNCSDLFVWGCEDAETITVTDLAEIQKAYDELKLLGRYAELYTLVLWCCRKLKLRPQVAYYKHLTLNTPETTQRLQELFNNVNTNLSEQYGTVEHNARKTTLVENNLKKRLDTSPPPLVS